MNSTNMLHKVNRHFHLLVAANILIILAVATVFVIGFAINYTFDTSSAGWFFTSDGLSFLSFLFATIGAVIPYLQKWGIFSLKDAYDYQVAHDMNQDDGLILRARHERLIQLTSSIAFLVAGAVLQGLSLWSKRGA